MRVWIDEIIIPDRIRKEYGDLDALAESIKNHGLLNPITLMESTDGYVLVAGFRRLVAMKMTGAGFIEARILDPMDAEEHLRIEIEENECRKDFTVAERIEYAMKLQVILAEKARLRQIEAAKGLPLSTPAGRVRDEVASRVGFKSGRQLDRALYLARNRPDLIEQVDSGKRSIAGAYNEARGVSRKQDNPEFTSEAKYSFVMYEVRSAADYFITALRQAAAHYKELPKSAKHSEDIIHTLGETAQIAQSMFAAVTTD